jgi:hypothetical protein
LDIRGKLEAKPLKVLALPSEAPKSRDYKDIVKGLGKSGGIDLQGVSVALPKQLVPEDENRDDGPETRRPATANGRPDRKNIISSINISRKAKPEHAETMLAAAMRAAMARKAVRV